MAWRAIQDTVGTSESLAALSDLAERLYWRILALSDPWGRLDARPRKLRAACYPMLPHITDADAGGALDELEQVERIIVWEKGGQVIVQIVDFEGNQPREAFRKRPPKSRFPDPPSTLCRVEGLVDRLYGTDPGQVSLFATSHSGSVRIAGVSGMVPEEVRNDSGTVPDERRGEETRRDQYEEQDLKQQQSSKENLVVDVARENGSGSAAAGELLAPTDSEVEQAVDAIPGHDIGTFRQVLPLARQLTATDFRAVLLKHADRVYAGRGTVRNQCGLLVQLLETAVATGRHEAAEAYAASFVDQTVSEQLDAQARTYARSIPWDAARDLLEAKLRKHPSEDPGALLEAARAAYDSARPKEAAA